MRTTKLSVIMLHRHSSVSKSGGHIGATKSRRPTRLAVPTLLNNLLHYMFYTA